MDPRDIPHQLHNPGSAENHEEFVMATAIPAPDNAPAPTERQLRVEDPSIAVQNVHTLAAEYGILFG